MAYTTTQKTVIVVMAVLTVVLLYLFTVIIQDYSNPQYCLDYSRQGKSYHYCGNYSDVMAKRKMYGNEPTKPLNLSFHYPG
jgi:hypothetical protein